MISHSRTTILLLFYTLILCACTKDPAIEPAGVKVCNEFILPVSINHDTIAVHSTSFSASTSIKLHSQYVPSLYLGTSTSQFSAYGQNEIDIKVQLQGAIGDSVGVFQAPWLALYSPGSFQIGDTLSPFTELHSWRYLYYYNSQAGVTAASPPPIWYFGFVQIIDGAKHVGYVRIGSSTTGGIRFWFEDARLAVCPGMPIVITD